MKRRHVLAAACLSLTGCAASGPELPGPAAATTEPVAGVSAARSGESAARTDASEPVLEVAEIPRVKSTAETPTAVSVAARSEVVCRLEKRTGTNRATRVCRTRAEIDRLETESKERFKELHRSQTEYQY